MRLKTAKPIHDGQSSDRMGRITKDESKQPDPGRLRKETTERLATPTNPKVRGGAKRSGPGGLWRRPLSADQWEGWAVIVSRRRRMHRIRAGIHTTRRRLASFGLLPSACRSPGP